VHPAQAPRQADLAQREKYIEVDRDRFQAGADGVRERGALMPQQESADDGDQQG